MTSEYISRAQLLLQYYAALNELSNENEPAMNAADSACLTELGFGYAGTQLSMVS